MPRAYEKGRAIKILSEIAENPEVDVKQRIDALKLILTVSGHLDDKKIKKAAKKIKLDGPDLLGINTPESPAR